MRSELRIHRTFARMAGGLIVSCQARPDNPLHGPSFMAAMARAAEAGGAVGLRINGPDDVRATRQLSTLPIVGLFKRRHRGSSIEITPTFEEAAAIAAAGADIIAFDATRRPRPDGSTVGSLIARIHDELRAAVMADVGDFEDGLAAEAAGADAVASTLSGYLDSSIPPPDDPDFELVEALSRRLRVPLIAEGRIKSPSQARSALDRGAFAVVVGTAITNPREITRWYVKALTSR